TWEQHKVAPGAGSIAERTATKMRNVERLYPSIGAVILRMKALNRLWQDRNHVTVGELEDWMPKYLYLPRIKNSHVIQNAISDASELIIDDTFATADAFDDKEGRYLGLRVSAGAPCSITSRTCLVNPVVAKKQKHESEPPPPGPEPGPIPGPEPDPGPGPEPELPQKPTLFVGSVKLDADRLGRDAGKIHEEILTNLIDLPNVHAEVTLEIKVRVPGGIEEDVVRVVTENATVLKFDHAGFEKE
ncbi:MAG TPA: AAA+ family ATPase, partial [Myxococcota bacterium]|nr:AAA+ family ATPase [Myxococcota bacterium]